jgi:hypothetical protein
MYEIFINEWIDNKFVLSCLKKLFYFETIYINDRHLLIINDHQFHVFVEFVKFCWKMKIVSLCLSSHTSHYFQFLDVDYFASLNKTYKKKLKEKNKTNVMHIIKFDFLNFLEKARRKLWLKQSLCRNLRKQIWFIEWYLDLWTIC